jgi:hypothetical protein
MNKLVMYRRRYRTIKSPWHAVLYIHLWVQQLGPDATTAEGVKPGRDISGAVLIRSVRRLKEIDIGEVHHGGIVYPCAHAAQLSETPRAQQCYYWPLHTCIIRKGNCRVGLVKCSSVAR